MQLIKSIIRPEKLDDVQDALVRLAVSGMTVTPVQGRGARRGETSLHRGQQCVPHLSRRVQLDVVVDEQTTDAAVRAIIGAARTGRPGDGNVYVSRISDTFRISTGLAINR